MAIMVVAMASRAHKGIIFFQGFVVSRCNFQPPQKKVYACFLASSEQRRAFIEVEP